MPLSPPICLNVYYQEVAIGILPNTYTARFTLVGGQPQLYSTGQYDCSTIAVGMWTGNSPSGYVFQIKSISEQTVSSCRVVLEDVNGYNAIIDPSQGTTGGAPNDQSPGYVYELSTNNLPILSTTDFEICALDDWLLTC